MRNPHIKNKGIDCSPSIGRPRGGEGVAGQVGLAAHASLSPFDNFRYLNMILIAAAHAFRLNNFRYLNIISLYIVVTHSFFLNNFRYLNMFLTAYTHG